MAENITLNAGAGGDTLAADEASAVSAAGVAKYQIIKMGYSAFGVKPKLVENSAGAGFPVLFSSPQIINNISATVNVAVTTLPSNIGVVNNISATVNVHISSQSASFNINPVSLTGTISVNVASLPANLGIVNNISATVNANVTTLPANIGTLNNISAVVAVSVSSLPANIGIVNNISATVNVNIAVQSATLNVSLANISSGLTFTNVGNVAHDAADSGNPIKFGGRAFVGADPTAVANQDRVDAWFDGVGRQVIGLWHTEELSGTATTVSATGASAVVAAPGAGLSLYICSIMATNKSASLSRVKFRESAGATGVLKVHGDCASGGGGFVYKPMRPWKLPANVALGGSCSPAVADIALTIEYFTMA